METEKRLICRDAALEAVCYNCNDKYDCKDRCSDYMEVLDIPTVDAVPVVHGRWEKFKLGWDDFALRLKCSNCGYVAYEWGFSYCPNCGASMKDGDGNG